MRTTKMSYQSFWHEHTAVAQRNTSEENVIDGTSSTEVESAARQDIESVAVRVEKFSKYNG